MNSTFCQICGRSLTDRESVQRGVGPECAAKRASFLGSCGTSETEIASLEAVGDDAARWVRNFRQDMRAGRVRQARQCIEIARRKADEVRELAAIADSEPPEPAIIVRPSERGYRVHPPYRHPQFVAAFKRTISGRWYAETAEWFIPTTSLQWARELLEYWFSMPVYIQPADQTTL